MAIITDTAVKGNNTVYTVEVEENNPITNEMDVFRFKVVVTDVCPGDPTCLKTITRCIRKPVGLGAYGREKARSFAKRTHLKTY